MAKIHLISEKYIKENSTIDDNVDVSLIVPFIDVAQIQLKRLLGKELLNEVIAQVGSSTLSTENETLLDSYIQPYLLWLTLKEANPYLLYKYRNKSVAIQSAEFSNPVSRLELVTLTKEANNKANLYAYEMYEFLMDNQEDYPLWNCISRPVGGYSLNLTNNRRKNTYAQRYRK
jgi:hypothetical protein